MLKSRLRWRGATTSVVALACAAAIACDSVLDIEDPKLRPADGGEPTSEPTGGSGNPAGAPTVSPEGGAAGELGLGGAGVSAGSPGRGGEGGEGGEATTTPRDCDTDSVRCTASAPEVCDASGHWVPNRAEADGDCAVQCHEGRCVECLPEDKRCTECEDGDDACNSNQPQTCVDGAWASEAAACAGFCDAGDCQMPRSCPTSAGAQVKCTTESCCKSLLVPGGTFKRSYDDPNYVDDGEYTDDASPATVSAFRLDKFEVTVGRFRQFVNAFGEFHPSAGDGKSARIAGDEGWSSSFTLPATTEALLAELQCDDASATWSNDPLVNNSLPINCVSFPVAYGFCIWDDARLPTEAEWNFAAAGGELQRAYPWPRPAGEDAITTDHASWDNADLGPLAVGSKPLGNGRWGQADLASNIREWVLDYSADYPLPCIDCAQWTAAPRRVIRGGAWHLPQESLRVSARSELGPNERRFSNGFRCARDVATTNGL
jgi:formylglycine-generating enzyme required for sulfatase activity